MSHGTWKGAAPTQRVRPRQTKHAMQTTPGRPCCTYYAVHPTPCKDVPAQDPGHALCGGTWVTHSKGCRANAQEGCLRVRGLPASGSPTLPPHHCQGNGSAGGE